MYFEPLIGALKSITKDEMGKEAIKDGLKLVTIENTRGNSNPEAWAKFKEGALTLDHDPITNVGDVGERTAKLVAVLENGL